MIKDFINILSLILIFTACNQPTATQTESPISTATEIDIDKNAIIATADKYLQQAPVPLTNFVAERSAGGIHDFYSEGDYWWPNPEDPDGSYIRKDGQTNPDNFTEHRRAMRNLNQWVSGLVAAYEVTNDKKYALHAIKHLHAFFLNPATLMNPNLLYAQAIKGKVTGRGIGIIDTIHLIEIVKAIQRLRAAGLLENNDFTALKQWFNDYATWMNTHEYGLKEKVHGNNHSTWWAAQLAAFAELAEREDLLEVARSQFKKLLPVQMADDGSFIDEMKRTKPYIYELFHLEGYSVLAEIASTPTDDLWNYETDGKSLRKGWDFMLPYIKDKSTWIKPPDVQNFDEVPLQTPGLLFAAQAYTDNEMLNIWRNLPAERKSEEINRNFPIREPVLWTKDELKMGN
ncbi:MAG: alginate lyase family protein [Saprospiraceae bacterium]